MDDNRERDYFFYIFCDGCNHARRLQLKHDDIKCPKCGNVLIRKDQTDDLFKSFDKTLYDMAEFLVINHFNNFGEWI